MTERKPINLNWTDETIMPFGKYKGIKLANVPADYLIYMYESKIAHSQFKDYIEDNLEVLRLEVKAKQNFRTEEEDE